MRVRARKTPRVQAVYCETPFFTWRAPTGTGNGLHVGVHELLYRELIPLIDSTARSVEFLEAHLSKASHKVEQPTRLGVRLPGSWLLLGLFGIPKGSMCGMQCKDPGGPPVEGLLKTLEACLSKTRASKGCPCSTRGWLGLVLHWPEGKACLWWPMRARLGM